MPGNQRLLYLNDPIVKPLTIYFWKNTYTASDGTVLRSNPANLGSMAVGMYDTISDACKVVKIKRSYHPDEALANEYSAGYEKYKKLYECLKSLFY